MEVDESRSLKKIFASCALLHFIAVIFCVGFYHFDEHFQILEFLALKLGDAVPLNLTWEFHERVRPWLQPAISFLITKFFNVIGVHDRFFLAAIFRLISSLIGMGALYLTALCAPLFLENKKSRKIFYWMLALTWFYPFLHARHSADNWGASLFIIALALNLILLKKRAGTMRENYLQFSHAFFIGLIFGLAFLVRFQIGISIFCVYLWWLIIGKLEIKSGLMMTASLIVALVLGIFVDSWGYQQFTFAPWNYLYADFILHVKGNHLPTPWYTYFVDALRKGGGPIAGLFITGVFCFWYRFRSDILTAATLPLFIIHSFIGHKELRFLMLIIYLAPIMSYRVWVSSDLKNKKWFSYLLKWTVGLNLIFLVSSIFTSANVAPLFYKKIDSLKIQKLYFMGEDPYTMLGLPLTFWGSKIERVSLEGLESKEKDFWLATTKVEQLDKISAYQCDAQYSIYPLNLVMQLPQKILRHSRIWVLHFCRGFR